jgi:8-oxo-dGTP diphosphatase
MGTVHASMKAAIVRDEKLLILQEDLGHRNAWDLPGGKLEYGETPEEALKREVREETGLEIAVDDYLGLYWFMMDTDDGQVLCNTFRCTPVSDEIDITSNPAESEEIVGYKWMTVQEFIEHGLAEHESLAELLHSL